VELFKLDLVNGFGKKGNKNMKKILYIMLILMCSSVIDAKDTNTWKKNMKENKGWNNPFMNVIVLFEKKAKNLVEECKQHNNQWLKSDAAARNLNKRKFKLSLWRALILGSATFTRPGWWMWN